MFEPRIHRNRASSAAGLLALIYHSTVYEVRKGHGAGGLGLITSVFQTLLMVAVFYAFYMLLGLRGSAIRGDFMLYILSGVFLYIMHVKAIGAVFSASGPTSPMMLHAPMNTIIAIAAAALGALYLQMLSILVILFVYHAAITPISIHDPLGALGMVLLAWFSGVAIGMVFLAAKPWQPRAVGMIRAIFTRLNMFASGKLFVANQMPGYMLVYFTWNPLFHIIDQARGYTFLNYNPHFSSVSYPIYVSLALIMVGLMGEFFTRQHASASWAARQ